MWGEKYAQNLKISFKRKSWYFARLCLQEGSIAASQTAESRFPKGYILIKTELGRKSGRTGKIAGFEEGKMVFGAALFSVVEGYTPSVRRSHGKGFLKQFILATVLGTL